MADNSNTYPVQTQDGTRYKAVGGDGVTTYKTQQEASKVASQIAAYRDAYRHADGKA